MERLDESGPTRSFQGDDASELLSGEGHTTLTSGPREVHPARGPLTTSDLGWQVLQGLVMAVMIVAVMMTLVFTLSDR